MSNHAQIYFNHYGVGNAAPLFEEKQMKNKHISEAHQKLADLGHKPLLPANQYCERCGVTG